MDSFRRLGAAALAGLALSSGAFAQADWPMRPIRIVAPYAAGGAGDESARTIAEGLSKALGQPVVVDNKPGAGGVIGADIVAKSPADGYTLLAGANGTLINPLIHRKLPYAASDLVPVTGVSFSPSLIVADPTINVNTLAQLQVHAKADSKGIFFGTTGIGSTGHFSGEMIKAALGVPLTFVQYKGSGETAMALSSHQVQLLSDVPSVALVNLGKAGKVRMLAVASDKRMPQLPDVPTTAEAGYPSIRMIHWLGLFAPKGTPPAVLDKLNAAAQTFISSPAQRADMAARNTEPMLGNRAQFTAFVDSETARLGKMAKDLSMVAE
ncbi:tripartite tricarboxylate transporter substrate binding protein [Variovorax sp. Sphag1AA]|uniref:tripartite tricarboxylate transporter substrate binding protein n=1 Tax=Variovorax sp. Sphag1AA TaxID=2587027 RepID=UPI00160E494B|nr:tripartite tricarboxylate transporter substrate binding protein [Variovorax sp. Sphag1AA]MBB3182232.1 tripartite-type tricarboxylate transporter receptor subunit TctC [Variovorax sp. Sphag1AA]